MPYSGPHQLHNFTQKKKKKLERYAITIDNNNLHVFTRELNCYLKNDLESDGLFVSALRQTRRTHYNNRRFLDNSNHSKTCAQTIKEMRSHITSRFLTCARLAVYNKRKTAGAVSCATHYFSINSQKNAVKTKIWLFRKQVSS